MGGWDLSTCNNVKIITQGRDVCRYPACTPPTPSTVQRVGEGARERGLQRLGHISMTPVTETLWVFKGLPGDRRPSVSAAYHT